jgi:hypothetical protein
MVFWKKQSKIKLKAIGKVSILVLLDGILEVRTPRIFIVPKKVSILVLLDGILEELRLSDRPTGSLRFNPCFVGWYSGSFAFVLAIGLQCLFQSLFCWMVFWKCEVSGWQFRPMPVSILVLLDGILEDPWRKV